jgi:hypothetical protein
MFKLYYASAIDCSDDQGKHLQDMFKKIFKKYPKIEVYGAGFGESPIISLESSKILKKAIVAYDLRKLRECDILLMVTDLETYCAGTHMELEYARNLGMLTVILCMDKNGNFKEGPKNIFLETQADTIIHSMRELEDILKEITA